MFDDFWRIRSKRTSGANIVASPFSLAIISLRLAQHGSGEIARFAVAGCVAQCFSGGRGCPMKRLAALRCRCSHRFSPNLIGGIAQFHVFRTWLGLGPNRESDCCYYPESHHGPEHLHETPPYTVPPTITLQFSRASFRPIEQDTKAVSRRERRSPRPAMPIMNLAPATRARCTNFSQWVSLAVHCVTGWPHLSRNSRRAAFGLDCGEL